VRKIDSFSLLVVIVCSLFFFIFGVGLTAFTTLQSAIGDVATWVAAVGTVATLGFAIKQNRILREEQKKETQERKIEEEKQRQELKKEREKREMHERKQQDMWAEQVELQKFQKFQFHKSLLDEQLLTLEVRHSGLIKFTNKTRLYELLFPQNSPMQVDLRSGSSNDGFQRHLASIIDCIVQNLLDGSDDRSRVILKQLNMLRTSIGIEFTGSIGDGGFSIYSTNEIDINLFDPLMTLNIMRDISATLINFSAEPGIHFASNAPYGKTTTRIQDFIIKHKPTIGHLNCSIENDYLNLLFYMKSFLSPYDIVSNCNNSELAASLIRSMRAKEDPITDDQEQRMYELLNIDNKALNSHFQLFIDELNLACISKDNALSYMKKHGGKTGVAQRFYDKLISNNNIDNKNKKIMLRYLRLFILRNSR